MNLHADYKASGSKEGRFNTGYLHAKDTLSSKWAAFGGMLSPAYFKTGLGHLDNQNKSGSSFGSGTPRVFLESRINDISTSRPLG